MNQDKVKRWVASASYYKLVRKKKELEEEVRLELAEGYKISPKRKISDDVISVKEVNIRCPILILKLFLKKEQRREDLKKVQDEQVTSLEKELEEKNERIKRQALIIQQLKEEINRLEENNQNDLEYQEEAHHRR